jgi:glutamine synthetase
MDKAPIAHAPRNLLKRLVARAENLGYVMKTGVEAEFFLLNKVGDRVADSRDVQAKPCYDQIALMRNYGVIGQICNAMEAMGWKPYQNDHEDGNGQFEMNWLYSDALTTADRHVLFKIMVRTVAEKNDLRATFMPKPFREFTGNGCHVHVSMWDKGGKRNLFESASDEMGLSDLAYHFMGGVLHHAKALSALTNPTVNSYKRLNATTTLSGATWSPNRVSYTGNNRTHMVRIPDGGRFEFRLADGSANPYLLQAGLLAAGLHGIEAKLAPGKRIDVNMYESEEAARVERLPGNLLDALRALESDQVLGEALGTEFVASYLKLRTQDWNRYMGDVSDWERAQTLDC